MLKSVRYCHAANAAMPDKFIQIREGAMVRNGLMVSAFTLIFAVSASAQDGLRRGGQRFMGQQQRYHLYEQQRRREPMLEGRDNWVLGPQPWWRTQNWCDANGTLFLCR
jgi:hypothetical protein